MDLLNTCILDATTMVGDDFFPSNSPMQLTKMAGAKQLASMLDISSPERNIILNAGAVIRLQQPRSTMPAVSKNADSAALVMQLKLAVVMEHLSPSSTIVRNTFLVPTLSLVLEVLQVLAALRLQRQSLQPQSRLHQLSRVREQRAH